MAFKQILHKDPILKLVSSANLTLQRTWCWYPEKFTFLILSLVVDWLSWKSDHRHKISAKWKTLWCFDCFLFWQKFCAHSLQTKTKHFWAECLLPSSFTAKKRREINLELVVFQKLFSQTPALNGSFAKLTYRQKILDLIKGQLNSNWIYEVIISSKISTKNYRDFCPGSLLEGRAEISTNFGWNLGRNDDLINWFWI